MTGFDGLDNGADPAFLRTLLGEAGLADLLRDLGAGDAGDLGEDEDQDEAARGDADKGM